MTDGNTALGDSPAVACEQDAWSWYGTRLKATTETTRHLTARYRLLINLELGLVLFFATVFYVIYTHHLIDPLAGTVLYAAGALLVMSIPGRYVVRTIRQLRTQRKITEYCEARKRRLDGTWPGTGDDGSEFAAADHPHCADLDVVGTGSLFEYLCSARTGAGRQWLATVLLSPASANDIMARQGAIDELRGRHDLREYLAEAGSSDANGFEGNCLRNWCSEAPIHFSPFVRITGAVLCIINVAIIALALSGRVSPELVLGTLAGVGLFTLAIHRKLRQSVERTDSLVLSEMELLFAYSRRLRRERFDGSLLADCVNSLRLLPERHFKRILRLMKLMRWHEDPAFTYLSYLSLWGALFTMTVENRRIKLGRDLAEMTAAVGELEGLSSLAAFAFEHADYPFASMVPSGVDQAPVFIAESLGHPLLETAICVRNPVRIDERNRFVLVSGSNMSGKSTYLRAIGLNYVLARAGAPVCAERLQLSLFSIATSIRVLDSLQEGKSRFLAEVSLVKRIIDLAEKGPVLFLFDELLSGTNSEDRRAGAAGVIAHLLARGASGFLTTHDLALSELVLSRPNVSRNVHFVDHIADEAMAFDYRLRDGIVPHSNGTAILAKLGIFL